MTIQSDKQTNSANYGNWDERWKESLDTFQSLPFLDTHQLGFRGDYLCSDLPLHRTVYLALLISLEEFLIRGSLWLITYPLVSALFTYPCITFHLNSKRHPFPSPIYLRRSRDKRLVERISWGLRDSSTVASGSPWVKHNKESQNCRHSQTGESDHPS